MAKPVADKRAYIKIPIPWPIEAIYPAFLPLEAVKDKITMRLGPGEKAPKVQIMANETQSFSSIDFDL